MHPTTPHLKLHPMSLAGRKRELEQEVKDIEESLENARKKLKKATDVEAFADVILGDACVICSRDLSEGISKLGRGISSYPCKCSRQRIVHTECWTRTFRCSCRVTAVPHDDMKAVREEIEACVESSYEGISGVVDGLQISRNTLAGFTEQLKETQDSLSEIALKAACDSGSIGERCTALMRAQDLVSKVARKVRAVDSKLVEVESKSKKVMSTLAEGKSDIAGDGSYFPSSPPYDPDEVLNDEEVEDQVEDEDDEVREVEG